ncbi:unnamed protein product [Cyprideis torosa]|uniref:Uridine diphosphate glucose pyrophosphatase NUDT14 n=1 Tax=Cyprideis torosa TaxID=163714 RepID=A0A7R8ZTF1_9CRUS|nr:unnamed protein product [Cyprideis torosa]CAG0897854.1 unnamed protein product [Cyprideis torosa]
MWLLILWNGKPRLWDMVAVHDSVSILIYNKTRSKFVFVRQFRPAVYYNSIPPEDREKIDTEKYKPELGVTMELCAGVVDKDKPLVEIAREEILEETGYDVPVERLQKIMTCRSGVGVSGSTKTMYVAVVEDSMRVTEGGGMEEEGEVIDVYEASRQELSRLLDGGFVNYSPETMAALQWWDLRKLKQFSSVFYLRRANACMHLLRWESLLLVAVQTSNVFSAGGGCDHEHELIEVVELSPEELDKYLASAVLRSPEGFLYAVLWFKTNMTLP